MSFAAADFKIQDVILLLGIEGRTGELVVEAGNNIGSLLFREGKILLAFSPYTRAIGDLLVEQGALTDTELLDVLKQQRAGLHMPIGSLLLKAGKVNFKTIEMMVHTQIRKSVQDFSSWQNVDFSFIKKDVRPFDEISLAVYEFLPPDIMKSAPLFVAAMARTLDPALGHVAPVVKR
jgi:hypothetical protein